MSGILDSRQRVMDTIVTLEGRRQISGGKLRVEYVSFTDASVFYQADAVSGSADPTTRIYFESCHLPQDQITFEADDSGKLRSFKNSSQFQVLGGNIFVETSGSVGISGSTNYVGKDYEYLTDSRFSSAAETILASSVDNFRKLQVLGTKDVLFLEEEQMKLSKQNINFVINKSHPIENEKSKISLVSLPSIFYNNLFSRSKNFRYLPPINKIEDKNVDRTDESVISENTIGNYTDFSEKEKLTFDSLNKELSKVEEQGYKQTIRFDSTSLSNKLVSQVFEITKQDMLKLDVFEFGSFKHDNKMKQVFFVGKVLTDDNQSDTFVRMFTLIFE
jgi:hypothetical protein